MGPGIIASLRRFAGGARRSLAVACGLLAVAASPVIAATTDSANAQATMIDTSSIVRVEDMDFGNIVQPNAAGTVVLTPGSIAACATTGGLIRGGPCHAAHFSVNGRRNKRVFIRENNGGTVTLTGPGGATMTMTNMTLTVSQMSDKKGAGGWDFGSWLIAPSTDIAEFWVGGTLNVASGQNPGVYTGTLNVQIQLN